MKSHNGIASLVGNKLTLEDRIVEHLAQVATDAELKDLYVDASDRQRVRRRTKISAVLYAIFEHGFAEVDANGIEIDFESDTASDLATVMREFQHDAELLNDGKNARGCLAPVAKESINPKNGVTAERKLIIIWLAVIELWDKSSDKHLFPTRKAVMIAAAGSTASTRETYKTNRSYIKNGNRFSQQELKLYHSLIKDVEHYANTPGEGGSALQILIPAARAMSSDRLPKKVSAERRKG